MRFNPGRGASKHLAGIALSQHQAGLFLLPAIGGKRPVQEVSRGELRQIGSPSTGRLARGVGGDAPNAPVLLVAARIAEIDLAVLDNRIAPIGNVQRAIRPEAQVDGAEGDVGGTEQIGLLLSLERRTRILHRETHDAVRAEITGDGVFLPLLGERRAVDYFEAGEFWIIARANAVGLAARVRIGEISGPVHGVINALTAGAVGEEGVAVLVPMVAPRIATAAGEDRQRPRIRIEAPDTARVEASHPVGRLDVGVRVNRLVHVEVPVITPAQRVEIVMGVLGTEARQRHRTSVGLAISIGVLQMQKLMTGRHVASALSIGDHARGN